MTATESPAHLGWPVPEGAPLNRPRRALLAAGEVVLACLLAWFAVWSWSRGTTGVAPLADRPDLVFERFEGAWVAGSVAVATVAALLLLDAVRQLVLAVRARPRSR